ncbi:MAG: hypothetical protein B7Y45_12325 [Sphingomonas sp. 28-66-16]|nr:MAG: hypothetical protein B7Y45_12325 [Sphingomonas sp. 28-66-16]
MSVARTRLAGGIGATLIIVGISAAIGQSPRDGDAPPPGPARPPEAALDACRALAAGARCSFAGRDGAMTGSCFAPPGRPPACRPAGAPLFDDDRGNDQRTAIAGTAVSTAAIACTRSHDALNPGLNLLSRYAWSCTGSERRLTGNGIPDHVTGSFPNRGNPNRIAEQDVRFTTALVPQLYAGEGQRVKLSGYALNGIKFDPGTAQTCTEGCANAGRSHDGQWRIEALGQSYFDFGVDSNNAHVQPGGAYHYHGVPTALVERLKGRGGMALIGFAVDGFAIYGPEGHDRPMDASSPIRTMRPSYRLKARPDAGRPPVTLAPMGTFVQDYEYVAGLGDLDECNGRTDVTPEFPTGAYHYYATRAYPYLQRCVKGRAYPGADENRGPPPGGGARAQHS